MPAPDVLAERTHAVTLQSMRQSALRGEKKNEKVSITIMAQRGAPGCPGWPLTSAAADQGWQGARENSKASSADV